MSSLPKGVRTLWLAAGAVASTLLGGILVSAGVLERLSWIAVLGWLFAIGGQSLFMVTVFLILRREHDVGQEMLRRVIEVGRTIRKGSQLDEARLADLFDAHAQAVIRDVDARIIGLYELMQRGDRP